MNKETLERMSASELDEYAKSLGFSAKAAKGAEDKIKLIEKRRNRIAQVRVLGMDIDIPVKNARDKRVTDQMAKAATSDEAALEVMRLMVGDEQLAKIEQACTDEDGTVDVAALGLAYKQIVTSKELKNL